MKGAVRREVSRVVLLVIDTNVIVSALLKPGSVPDRALHAIWKQASVLYDTRMHDEYKSVLERPKFRSIERQRIADFLEKLTSRGTMVGHVDAWSGAMKDDDDRMFIEVALAGHADAIVTGNIADYPIDLGFEVLPPATLFARLGLEG